jgi:hypothetical protein
MEERSLEGKIRILESFGGLFVNIECWEGFGVKI